MWILWFIINNKRIILLSLFLLLNSCASLSQQISNLTDRGEYTQARALLEKEGVGEQVRANAKPEAMEAKRLFASNVESRFREEATILANSGAIRSAVAKLEEGLAVCPWSDVLSGMRRIFAWRIEMVDSVVSKWKNIIPAVEMSVADARKIVSDLKKISPDYADTPSLIHLHSRAVSVIIKEWEKSFKTQQYPITPENTEQFRVDIKSAGLESLNSDECINALISLSSNNIPPQKFTIARNRDSAMKGASCLSANRATTTTFEVHTIQVASREWVERWYNEILPKAVTQEEVSFGTIDAYEDVLNKLSPSVASELRRQLGLLHLFAAEKRVGSGASAVLSLIHIVRADELNKDIPTGRIQDIKKKAVASLLAGERLESLLAIDSEPSVNTYLYDLVRLAFMIGIRSRTRGYFTWHFLPPGQSGGSEGITIDAVNLEIPSYESLNTVVSEYLSHFESVPNPYKAYLASMLTSAEFQMNWAESSYKSAVSIHNIYPTQYSLRNVNNAYNDYVSKVNYYNIIVRQYNATSSTVERPVYMPYSFKEGHVKYGWEVRARYNIGGKSGITSGKSMDSDFVRVGTRYNDKNASNRREDDLNFTISLERTIDHLYNAVKMVLDQIEPAMDGAVPLKFTSGLTDRELKTARWFLHPWSSNSETGRKSGVPEWALSSALSVELPVIEYKPAEVVLPTLKDRPKVPLGPAAAAKWFQGLVGEIFAQRRGGNQAISTGAIISPDGLILTSAHGLSGEDLRIEFNNTPWAGSYEVEIVFINDDSDVALIRAKGLKTKRWIEVRLDGSPEKGEEIVAIGNPSLPDGSQSIEAISKGIVSDPESRFYGVQRIVADITIASGSSGGPLISLNDGKIVGVIVAVAEAGLAQDPGRRSASGTVCLAAPSKRLTEWLGIKTIERAKDIQNH